MSTDEAKIHLYELDQDRFRLLFSSFEDAKGRRWSLPGRLAHVWSPDGRHMAVAARLAGSGLAAEMFILSLDHGDTIRQLLPNPLYEMPRFWSRDGDRIVYTQRNAREGQGWNIWELPLEPPGDPRPLAELEGNQAGPTLSPDGRWLDYHSNETGRYQIYLKLADGRGRGRQISTDGGWAPVWSPDAKTIYYQNGSTMMAIDITSKPTLTAAKPRLLFDGVMELNPSNNARSYDLSPDGRKFVMIQPEQDSATPQIPMVQNWFDEMKRLVPVN